MSLDIEAKHWLEGLKDFTTGILLTIPAGVDVWPVYENRDGKLWAEKVRKTDKPSVYLPEPRKLPTDGQFRSFHFRNKERGRQFEIAMFAKPIRIDGRKCIGCVVDMSEI